MNAMTATERVAIVTGATRGIGRAVAITLARMGTQVVLVGRDEARLDAVRVEARRVTKNERVFWVHADFASLASVRAAGEEIAHRWPTIHVLVNNAGINSARRATSVDGHELTFAVNHLAPFLLTMVLVPALANGSPSRVVNVASVFAHVGRIDFDDLMFERHRYGATRAYTRSKLATAMLTIELAERVENLGIAVNCVSPGLVATDLLREHWWSRAGWLRPFWRRILLSPEDAAARIVRVATDDALAGVTGQCFAGTLRPSFMPRAAHSADARGRLWVESVRLANSPAVRSTARAR
jgi:NAD(P)-dependent dehydrogenase (short-subunit alcohol dehydrogenase family)